MLKYKIDVMEALKKAGYNTSIIRKEKLLGENSLQNIRENKVIGIIALDKICTLLKCQPGDIIEWIPDEPM